MGFIDAHTHLIFPRLIGSDVERIKSELRDGFKAIDYENVKDVVKLMDELGMDYVVIMAYPASIYGDASDLPLRVINVVKDSPYLGVLISRELMVNRKRWIHLRGSMRLG